MDYIPAKEAAKRRGVSERRVQKLCGENRMPGAVRFVRVRAIPKNTEKPADARLKKTSFGDRL